MGLLDLTSGDTTAVDDVAGFQFNASGTFLAMSRYSPQGERDANRTRKLQADFEVEVLRVTNDEVLGDLDAVMEFIRREIRKVRGTD